MKILVDPRKPNEAADVFIPPHLRKHIAPWANARYKKYNFGHVLTQDFICKDYSIFINYFIIEHPVTIYTAYDKPTVAILQQLKTFGLCYLPSGLSELCFTKGIFESLYVEFEPDWIKDIAESNDSVNQIFQATNKPGRNKIFSETVAVDHMISHCISNIRECKEIGTDLYIEFKTQILELLNLYRKATKEKLLLNNLPSIPHKEELFNIWQKIRVNPNIHLHNLSILSKQNFMHEKTLSRNFKKLFSVDLQTYVMKQCMEKGHHLISTTSRKIQDISYELGYKETNSFNRAFKRYFSVSPQALRS